MFENHEGAVRRSDDQASGILEDTRTVTLHVNKRLVATIKGVAERLFEAGGLSWRTYYGWELVWEHSAALALLQGRRVTSILSESYILLNGSHRPAYHPVPGIDSCTIAEIWTNVQGLSIPEMFERIAPLI